LDDLTNIFFKIRSTGTVAIKFVQIFVIKFFSSPPKNTLLMPFDGSHPDVSRNY